MTTAKIRLIAHVASVDMVAPDDTMTSFVTKLTKTNFLPDGLGAAARKAEEMIALVKSAPDNPYGDDDEAIAAEIMRRFDAR